MTPEQEENDTVADLGRLTMQLIDLNFPTAAATTNKAYQELTDAGITITQLQEQNATLEAVNAQRKSLNAQMLMNAAESGNRNYLAEIEQLTEQNQNYKEQIVNLVKEKHRREQ